MRVVRAAEMGMCFGVKDALARADAITDPDRVTVHGDLVHNRQVLIGLRRRGFRLAAEADRGHLPATPAVLITAHGVSERERARLAAAGKTLVDTTCPLVRYVHARAIELAADGRLVLVLGRRDHVEVQGIVGDLERFEVVEREDEVRCWDGAPLGIVCQSTLAPDRAAELRRAIERANPESEIRFFDTICGPTRNRQLAMEALLGEVEAVVVVGGRHSNNTRALARLAEARGVPAFHVESASELDPGWLQRFAVVGLTAGTSTLDETIEEVHRVLLEVAAEPAPTPTIGDVVPAGACAGAGG